MKKILVDTSIWIEYFKGNNEVQKIIHDKDNYQIYITGPIFTELTLGIKNEKEKDIFTSCFQAFPFLKIEQKDWINAGQIGNNLRKHGVSIPLADLIIFTIAEKNNCALFTLDKHFSIINKTLKKNIEIFCVTG